MNHPSVGLSGGQKAKLMFLMMAESGANVLLLDEPTRNLSPLSGPVIRELLAEYPGCIITVSHDRRLIQEVCTRTVTLTPRRGAPILVLRQFLTESDTKWGLPTRFCPFYVL